MIFFLERASLLTRFLRFMHTYIVQYITLVAIAHSLLNSTERGIHRWAPFQETW